MDSIPFFNITLTPHGTAMPVMFTVQAEDVADLWDRLESGKNALCRSIKPAQVMLIEVDGLSKKDVEFNNALRTLAQQTNDDFILHFHCDIRRGRSVYLVAVVHSKGNLVEFQVSDGLPGQRSFSSDCYAYSEAKAVSDHIVKKGWKNAQI